MCSFFDFQIDKYEKKMCLSIIISVVDVDGYIASFVMVGIGSPSIFYALLTLGQFFPARVSTILSLLNCSFDASVVVFAVFRVIVLPLTIVLFYWFMFLRSDLMIIILCTVNSLHHWNFSWSII